MTPSNQNIEIAWEILDDKSVLGYIYSGEEIVIDALQDRKETTKWNITYMPGRRWSVYSAENRAIGRGWSKDLRAAKRDATTALAQHLARKEDAQ